MTEFRSRTTAGHRAGHGLVALAVALVVAFGWVEGYAVQAEAERVAEIALPGDAATQVDGDLRTRMTVEIDELAAARVDAVAGADYGTSYRLTPDAKTGLTQSFDLALHVSPMGGGRALIATSLTSPGPQRLKAHPTLLVRLGEPAIVEVKTGDGAHRIALTFVATATPHGLG